MRSHIAFTLLKNGIETLFQQSSARINRFERYSRNPDDIIPEASLSAGSTYRDSLYNPAEITGNLRAPGTDVIDRDIVRLTPTL